MKKEYTFSVFILIGFLSLLYTIKPLREAAISYEIDLAVSIFLPGILIRFLIFLGILFLIKKFKLFAFNGLSLWQSPKNLQATFITFAFLGAVGSTNIDTYSNAEFHTMFLFGLSTLLVGFLEEFTFRGTIFPLFIKALKKNKRSIFLAAISSNLLFGLIHYVNLFSEPENFIGITRQVFFAFSVGVFFCGVMVRTENILIPGLLHALVNFCLGTGDLKEIAGVIPIENLETTSNWPEIIVFGFIFLCGVFMILKADKKSIITKLEIEN